MNEKYSKYINSRYGFVTDYSIQKSANETDDDKLLVYTATVRLSQPHVENLTKERVKYFENRKKNQYQLIFDNKDEIIKSNKRKTRGIIYPLAGLLLTASFLLRSISIPLIYAMSLSVMGVSLIAISEIAIILITERFESKLKTYQNFLENSEEIEKREKEDKNITKNLNEETNKLISENQVLQQEGYIDNVFNTNLMDNMSLKELRQLLLRYKISKALEEPQSFRLSGAKTLKRTPTENK